MNDILETTRYQDHGRKVIAAKTEKEKEYYKRKQKNLKNAHVPRKR